MPEVGPDDTGTRRKVRIEVLVYDDTTNTLMARVTVRPLTPGAKVTVEDVGYT